MLNQYLDSLGFSENEKRTFLALLETGKATAQTISKAAGLARSTIYGALDLLVKKGVVGSEQSRSTSYYFLCEPGSFRRMIERERDELKKKELIAEEVVNIIKPHLKGSSAQVPRLQYYEGKEAVENMLYESIPKWRASYERLDHYTMWGYQDHTFVEQYRKWHDYAWRSRSFREEIRLYSNKAGVDQQKKERIEKREIRPLPEDTQFASSIWVHGDFVVLANTRKKPHYAFQIHDPTLSSNLRTVFQLLWRAKLA